MRLLAPSPLLLAEAFQVVLGAISNSQSKTVVKDASATGAARKTVGNGPRLTSEEVERSISRWAWPAWAIPRGRRARAGTWCRRRASRDKALTRLG